MFNNGNNGGGNPNHASDGKFTSGPNQAGNGGNKVEQKPSLEDKIKEKLGISNDSEPSLEDKVKSNLGMTVEKKKKFDVVKDGKVIGTVEANSPEEAQELGKEQLDNADDDKKIDVLELQKIMSSNQKSYISENENAGQELYDLLSGLEKEDIEKEIGKVFPDDFGTNGRIKTVLSNYLFDNISVKEMSENFGISEERISRLLGKGLNGLYSKLKNNDKYDQKIQSQLGIKSPVVEENDGDDSDEEMPDLYADDEKSEEVPNLVYYEVKSKNGLKRYYQVYNNEIQTDLLREPQGEEHIIPISFEDFDSLIESGKLSFKKK